MRFFLLGALLGPIGDYCHVLSGTLAYPGGGIPLWTPLLFGSATWLISLAVRHLAAVEPVSPHPYVGLAVFLSLYCVSGFLPHGSWIADAVLYSCALAQFKLQGGPLNLGLALVAAAGGTAFEATLVHFGVFAYLAGGTGLFGVPTWLPSLYISAWIAISQFERRRAMRAPALRE